jgi:hypothetical protein
MTVHAHPQRGHATRRVRRRPTRGRARSRRRTLPAAPGQGTLPGFPECLSAGGRSGPKAGATGRPAPQTLSCQKRVNAAAGQRPDAVPLDSARWHELTAERYRLRGFMRGVARCDDRLESLVCCGRGRVRDAPYVELYVHPNGSAYVGRTVPRCGSVQVCPVCSPPVRSRYAEKIAGVAGTWELGDGGILLVTFTIPHGAGDDLAETYALVNDAWRWMTARREWKAMRAKLGTFEWARATECTHSDANGFHPHTQAAIFVDGVRTADAVLEMYATAWPLWRQYVARRTGREPTMLHGIHVEICQSPEAAAGYLAKSRTGFTVGQEITRGDLKLGRRSTVSRTYFEILRDYADHPNDHDGRLLLEYMTATHRRRAFSFSRGFTQLLGTIDDFDEAEAAAEVPERAELAALVTAPAWDAAEEIVPDLLHAVAVGGRPQLDALLVRHGLDRSLDPRPVVGRRRELR